MAVDHLQRAGSIWPILVQLAKTPNETIAYGQLARRIGIHHRPIRFALTPIQDFCIEEGLPRLTSMAVNAHTKAQGAGYAGRPGDEEEMAVVRRFDWDTVPNPFPTVSQIEIGELAKRIVARPDESKLVFVLVESRGDQQRIFRQALLDAYRAACAVCGTTFAEVLEAAHIDPWCASEKHRRIDPRNGLLLCANHHRLFDSAWLRIDPDYFVRSYDPDEEMGTYAPADTEILTAHDGEALRLPRAEHLWPDKELLLKRFREAAED